jgi:hypothetical protein
VITSDVFACQVTLEFPGLSGAVFSDIYFNLPGGVVKKVDLLRLPVGDCLVIRSMNAQPVEIRI